MNKAPVFDLDGHTALITGGGSGLGLGIARCMSACGAKVILVGRDAARLRDAAEGIGALATWEQHDVSDLGASASFAARIESRHGPVHTLVNNAGNHLKKVAWEVSDAEFQGVLGVHVNAAFALSREFGRSMMDRGNGHILFTASMASLFGIPQVAAYSAAKAALLGLVRSLAVDLSPSGVRVNAIAPGWIDSNIMRTALAGDPARAQRILSRTPLQRFGEPDDVGWAAAYLSSPAAKFITGVCLPVDGGISIGF